MFWFKFLRILKIRIKNCILLISATCIYEFYGEIKLHTGNRATSAHNFPGKLLLSLFMYGILTAVSVAQNIQAYGSNCKMIY
jgi:hypothetical protein